MNNLLLSTYVKKMSCSTGSVNAYASSAAYAGGLVGYNNNTYNIIKIENCYATGSVVESTASSAYAGGLLGYNYSCEIMNCFSTGNITVNASSFAYAGGLVGDNYYSNTITNCYRYSGQTFYRKRGSTVYNTASNTSGTATTLTNLQSESFLTGTIKFNKFISEIDLKTHPNNLWVFTENQYPKLYWKAWMTLVKAILDVL